MVGYKNLEHTKKYIALKHDTIISMKIYYYWHKLQNPSSLLSKLKLKKSNCCLFSLKSTGQAASVSNANIFSLFKAGDRVIFNRGTWRLEHLPRVI